VRCTSPVDVRPERLAATARWMARLAAQWDTRLAAIKHLAEAAGPEDR
jgi:hypothetical protein